MLKQDRKNLRVQLRLHSKWKKTVLIIPTLASEFTDPANLPVFQNILSQLKATTYLSQIIFGLDGATEDEARTLKNLIDTYGVKNCLIQFRRGKGPAECLRNPPDGFLGKGLPQASSDLL